MYLHFREEVDDQHSGNDKSKADDGWQVGLLVESKHTDERNKYDAHGSPDAVGYADGQCAQGVPLAVVCAVPMYANAAGIVPVIEVFVAKGIPLGTAIAFMMAVVGLSLPEATLLKKVMTWRLVGIFFGIVTLFIILSGYLFNVFL